MNQVGWKADRKQNSLGNAALFTNTPTRQEDIHGQAKENSNLHCDSKWLSSFGFGVSFFLKFISLIIEASDKEFKKTTPTGAILLLCKTLRAESWAAGLLMDQVQKHSDNTNENLILFPKSELLCYQKQQFKVMQLLNIIAFQANPLQKPSQFLSYCTELFNKLHQNSQNIHA